MVVHHQYFLFQTSLVEIFHAVDDQIQNLAGLLMRQIIVHDRAAAPGINQVIEADAVDIFFLHQIQYSADIFKIALIYSYNPNEKLKDYDEEFIMDENNENTEKLDQSSREFLDSAINDYNEMFGVSYSSSSENFQSYYKDISLRTKNKEIDLLIVVNMFLTGFDAPTLNTLFIDK